MNKLNSHRGQMAVEAVLILTLLLGVSVMVSNYFKSEELLIRFIQNPWGKVSGLIQNGQFLPPEDSLHLHPNNRDTRFLSVIGEDPK